MGFSFNHLKTNGNKVVVEREEDIFVEQDSDNYIKRRRTIIRERYPARVEQSAASKKGSLPSKKESTKGPLIIAKKLSLGKLEKNSARPIDGPKSVEAEIEITLEAIIKSEQSQERPNSKSIQAAYDRLGYLEASINHEINKLKQQRSDLRMNISKQKKTPKQIRQNVEESVKVNSDNKRSEIAAEKFSNRHQCVCTSPRYGGIEELSCRPRERTIASQMDDVTPIQDRGAVGDHISLNNIPNESPQLEQPSKNDRNLNELKDLLTAPDVDKNDHPKVNDQIVNYCYCRNNNCNHTCCNQCYNNMYYQDTGTTGSYYYNYSPNAYCQVDPCSSPNYCHTTSTATQPTCRCRCAKRSTNGCRRRRTDLDTDHFYSRSSSPSSKRNDDKCGKFDNTIKAQLEKELKAQLKSAKEKERYKKRYKELCEKLREQEHCEKKLREEEKKRCQSTDRQCGCQACGNICKRILEKLHSEGTSKLIKLLDRYCDEKSEDKKKNVTVTDRCHTVRSREKVCQITVKKCKPRRTDMMCADSEPATVAKCYCPEYCIQKVECFDKKSSEESQYPWETLQMLKKMKIKEYKPVKPKSPKATSDKQSLKDKQYTDYINKYKRAEKQDTDTDSLTQHSKRHERNLDDKLKNNKEKYAQSICCEEFPDVCCINNDTLDYDKFQTEMDTQLGISSPNECSTNVDSARTYTRCKDEEIQAYCSADVSISSPSKAKKALASLKEFLESFTKSCPKEDKELLCLQTAAAEILSKLAACKLKDLQTCETQTDFKGCDSTCAGVQTSHYYEDEWTTKQAVDSLKEFLGTLANSCAKEDDVLLYKTAKAMSKVAACKASELDDLNDFDDCKAQIDLRNRHESIGVGVQTPYPNREENKTKKALESTKEFIDTFAKSCPKDDEELLDLQITANEVMSKIAACKALELKNLKACETRTKLKQSESICAGIQTSRHNMHEMQYHPYGEETELDYNLIIEEPPPLSHATYQDEYYCLPMPQYASTDIYGGSHSCPDNKHFYDRPSVREATIKSNRNNVYPRSVSTRNSRTCSITDYNDSYAETINQQTLKDVNFTNYASSTVIGNGGEGSAISQPLCSSIATTSHDMINKHKTFQEMQATPTHRSPCPSTSKSITMCSKRTPSLCASAATTSRNNSPNRSKRTDSPNRCCFKESGEQTPRTSLDEPPPLRSILKSSPNINQEDLNKDECRKQQSEISMICKDKDNRSIGTCEDVRSQCSQISNCSGRSGNLSAVSKSSQQRRTCIKCPSTSHISSKSQINLSVPAFNNCPCMQDIYYDILDIYFKGKERNQKMNCHLKYSM